MLILQAIVYGVVQGITEFLPVSSTAHLILVPWIFGWQQPGVAFDVALHLGTAAAVILYFARDWAKLIKEGFTNPRSTEGKLFWFIVLASIPGAIAGIFLDAYMAEFSSPIIISVMLMVMGVVLYLADKLSKKDIQIDQIGFKRSILVGLAQVLAIIPGVSRSGITMATGRALGIERASIAKFTFLLATPIILGDALYHIKDIMNEAVSAPSFIVAVITAAVVGIISIRFLLNFLKKRGFGVFALYRLALGIVILTLCLLRG